MSNAVHLILWQWQCWKLIETFRCTCLIP